MIDSRMVKKREGGEERERDGEDSRNDNKNAGG